MKRRQLIPTEPTKTRQRQDIGPKEYITWGLQAVLCVIGISLLVQNSVVAEWATRHKSSVGVWGDVSVSSVALPVKVTNETEMFGNATVPLEIINPSKEPVLVRGETEEEAIERITAELRKLQR